MKLRYLILIFMVFVIYIGGSASAYQECISFTPNKTITAPLVTPSGSPAIFCVNANQKLSPSGMKVQAYTLKIINEPLVSGFFSHYFIFKTIGTLTLTNTAGEAMTVNVVNIEKKIEEAAAQAQIEKLIMLVKTQNSQIKNLTLKIYNKNTQLLATEGSLTSAQHIIQANLTQHDIIQVNYNTQKKAFLDFLQETGWNYSPWRLRFWQIMSFLLGLLFYKGISWLKANAEIKMHE